MDVGVVVALLVVVVALAVAVFLRVRRGIARTKIIIVGPCGAGKTLLFSQLCYGKHVETQTSMEENEGRCQVVNKVGRERSR